MKTMNRTICLIAYLAVTAVFGAEEGQGVFNGDIGFIVSIDPQEHVMQVQFDDERLAEYEGADVDDLELAYCISVHKSQGSEFPVVVMPAVGGPPMLLTRNLFYTAVTRARRMVMIVGRESAIDQMIANVNTRRRYSALKRLLMELDTIVLNGSNHESTDRDDT